MSTPSRPPLARVALACAAALAILAAAPGAAAGAAARTLTVAAAANVRPAVDELAAAFRARHPGVVIRVTSGASGTFFAQLREGAPFDVFFSADREYPRRLVEAGLASARGETVYAVGALVLWVPPGSRLDVERRGLAALADPSVRRVAIANPAVAPYGRAAMAALEAAGVAGAVRPKLVTGESVGQAAQFARSGAADAALLPRSLAGAPELLAGRAVPVPPAPGVSLEQSAVVLRRAADPALADAFVAFAAGPAGRAVLARHGYALP